MTLDRRRVRVSGGELAVVDQGEGKPVVLLHGFPTSSHLWRDVVPLLATRARAVAVDLLGYGDSEKPSDRPLGIRAQARYVRELLGRLGLTFGMDGPRCLIVACGAPLDVLRARIAGRQRGSPGVVPGRVVVLADFQIGEIGRRGGARIARVPGLLRGGARPLRLGRQPGGDEHEDTDQRRRAAGDRLGREHQPGQQQRDPGAGPAALGAALGGGRALIGRDEIADGARLVRQLGCHNRALGRVGDGAEHVVAPARPDRIAREVLLPCDERAEIVPHGNPGRLAATLGDENQTNAEPGDAPGFLQRPAQRIVRFAIGEHHQHAVGDLGAGPEQIDPLGERRREVRMISFG